MESILKRSIAELEAVLLSFSLRLAFQELLKRIFREAGPQ